MAVFTSLKKRIARRMARSSWIKRLILEEFEKNPEALAALGGRPETFEIILDGASKSGSAMVRIVDHPDVLARLMKSPKAFEKLLEAVSANPESLYRILSKRGVRSNLAAQNDFLKRIAGDRRVMLNLMEKLPSNLRSDAIKAIVGPSASRLQDLSESPDAMAAALLYRAKASKKDIAQLDAADQNIIDGLIDCLEGRASEVLLAMVEADPSLLDGGPVHDQAIRAIRSNPASISELCAMYAVTPSDGKTPSARVNVLLMRLFQEPVIVQAMLKDAGLRQNMLHIVQDSIEAAGDTVPNLLEKPRTSDARPEPAS